MDRFTSLAARMRLSTVPPNRPSSEIRRGLDLSIGHDPTVSSSGRAHGQQRSDAAARTRSTEPHEPTEPRRWPWDV